MSISGGLTAGGGLILLRQVKPNVAAWAGFLRRTPRGGRGLGLWHWSARVVIGAAATLAVLAVVVVTIDAWAIGQSRALPPEFHMIFGTITDFGKSGWFLFPIGLALVVLGLVASPRIGRGCLLVVAALAVRLSFVFAAIALPGLFATIVKRLIGRARPFVGGSADPYLYDPFVWQAAYASLPSGHATTAFAASVAIGSLWPQTRPYVWLYALLIAVSRVVVTVHHPSDVIAGAVVGVVGAVLVRNWFAGRRLAFTIDAGGNVHRMPAPSWRRIKSVARRLWAA
ncbi:MAG: phosphatase PAP2 family protein [Rhizobiales bacterium]|nr:phosphatase PAP2 family protein [Hyphomicrobiales bacterium]